MIRDRLARGSDFTQESCASVVVGHALHYKPSIACENTHGESQSAKRLVDKIKITCLADALQLVSPGRLCETHAQYLTSEFVWLNALLVVTSAVLSEWIHYCDEI